MVDILLDLEFYLPQPQPNETRQPMYGETLFISYTAVCINTAVTDFDFVLRVGMKRDCSHRSIPIYLSLM